MTTAADIPRIPRTIAAIHAPREHASSDWLAWAVATGVLLIIYLLLQNPYWVPGGDSEVYTGAARSIAQGHGNMFNGLPVTLVPPGWQYFMAGVMKISPTFLVLKLITMSCMFGALAIDFWICRRFASAWTSALAIVLAGLISHVYSLTFWLHSDAMFCLISSAALLLAFQIKEGRTAGWRVAALTLLCVAAVIVRWAGLLSWLLVGAALLHDELMPRINRAWVYAFITGLATLLAFIAVRYELRVSAEIQREIRESGVIGEDNGVPVDRADANVATTYSLFNPARGGITGLIARAIAWGNWIGYLLWQPLRLGRSSNLLGLVSLAVGSMALLSWLIAGLQMARSRQWFWPAMLLYSFMLALNWPAPNARYLVPIAPFIILGVFRGMELIRLRWPNPAVAQTCRVLAGYFVVSLVICNGALWAVDVWVARSEDFYANYEAGMDADLISVSRWLTAHNAGDLEIGATDRYVNLGKVRISRLGLRVTSMLTGKSIVGVNGRYVRLGDPRDNPHFLAWARGLGVKYVLYQTEVSPWRLFHFRVGFLQELMSDQPAVETGAGWRLYYIPGTGDSAKRVMGLSPSKDWPTRVPGM
ncbi:MAG TPA: hypothetical protein VHD56_09035 [Tepidisphaeraceae bacterium]|nr:hypothetical protein [Tepidisphaeraceae bacterium]